ncbi:hypothetical protein [Altererythrobacter sp. GH1-8]|uniref:hypothetical protein n=1 Tax=Altererythrobacter sp. GH1-8 TaxID=3349333 RepID=UPI00374DB130
MPFSRLLSAMRQWIAKRLGITAREARDGQWWEIDFLLVFFAGILILGLAAFL